MGRDFFADSRRPLTRYQRDIWISGSRFPEHPQFNIVYSTRLEGELDVELLRQCAIRTIARHDPWHLRFAEQDGTPYQWLERETPDIAIIDFSNSPRPEIECAAWMDRSLAKIFPLERHRMMEVALLRESASVAHLHVKVHHIVADALALDRLHSEVLTDYAHALQTGQPAELSGSSYLDGSNEEERYVASAERTQDIAFFREHLAGVTPALFSRKEKEGQRRTGRYSFTVDGATTRKILESGGTPSAYLSAALVVYLARIHRSEEIVLGVPYANRSDARQRNVWGHFANMLPVRIAVPGDASMRELIAQVRGSMVAARAHERLPLGDVLWEVAPRGPLFDVTFSYVRFPAPRAIPGISRSRVTAPSFVHDQDVLSLSVRSYDGDDDIYVDLFYACDVFDEDMPIDGVARALQTILASILDEVDRPVSTVALLGESERAALLAAGTGPRARYRHDATVHGLFEERAALCSNQVAIVAADGTSMTFGELDARANQLAHALRKEGVRPDDRVAVLMDRSPAMLIAVLGVLKSGGAYVPIDTGYPEERIRFVLEDSRAKVVLVSRQNADVPGAASDRLRIVEDFASGPATRVTPAMPETPDEPAAGPRDLAYVIYTSGSTGRPKGAMVEHHAVINRLAWMQKAYPLRRGDVLLQKTPIAFDVSVWELFWWAIEGASLALLPPGAEKDPDRILSCIRERRVTAIHFVPSMFGPFLDRLEQCADPSREVESLRFVFCSGEALPPARVERFQRIFAGADAAPRLVNLYGPTEATVDVSYFDCPIEAIERVPIGRPIDNIRLYVLDRHDSVLPAGVPGELCIAGVGVARGYLDRPELTREKFVDDPFVPGERMYRTGDLARWLAGGNLEYLGRIDGQVKIRGNRVELGEVTHALAKIDGVRDAIVLDRSNGADATHLVGYYVAEAELEPAHLRAALAFALPEFMIPAYFARVEHIPLTPNGKADRRRLAQIASVDASRAYEAPRSEMEAALAAVWAEVLGLERVGIHDNYYTLGGDSITALRVRATAARAGVHFSLTDLVQRPTIAELAAGAVSAPNAPESNLEPFQLVASVDRARLQDREDAYPLTRLQLGMLYHSRRHPQSALYQDVFLYTFALPWNEAPFRRAFDRLVARHPALRTSFELGGYSEPLQIVHQEVEGGLDVTDLRSLSDEDARRAVARYIAERRAHRYRFDRAPLYSFRVHVRKEQVDLVLGFHHAILDGGSVANVLRELLQDYLHAIGRGIGPVLEARLPSLAHYVIEERRALESKESSSYWQQKLDGATLLELPSFRPHEPPGDTAFVVRHFELPAGLDDVIQRFAHAHAVPLKSILLAAHAQTLRHFAGVDDITTGLVTHGRPEHVGSERIAGLFLNTVPVRLATPPSTWLEAIQEAFLQEQEGHAHRRYPLSAIQEDCQSAVIETAFNYVHFHVLGPVLRGTAVELLDFQSWEATSFSLLVNAVSRVRDGRIALRIDGDGRAWTPAQIESFGKAYIEILCRMLEHPDEAPDATTARARPPAARSTPALDVVRAFEAQVDRSPEAVALAFGDVRWSYLELDRAANRVARRLLVEGGCSGAMTVGILMDRSPEMIAAVLGIAKAGGACLPLDTRYPKARISMLIEQARPFRIIGQAAYVDRLDDASLFIDAASLGEGPLEERPHLPPIQYGSAAYILFTSGSTGTPKGVVMPHRALANLASWQNRIETANAGGVTLQYAPLGFDVAFQEIFSTLCSGGSLRLMTESQQRDIPALLRLLDEGRVERIFMPYVALQQLAEGASLLKRWPAALRIVISSGEQLRVTSAIRRLCAARPGIVLENQYGPTETHVVTAFTMKGDPETFPALPPIGFPIDGAEVHVLDARLRPVPAGVRGEIYVGGVCLSDGYLGLAELTEERFVPHPSGSRGERLYRTGDLAMVLPNGAIVCLGRADEQVKVRGFRVEPAEVERAIIELETGIQEAAVVARRRRDSDAFLAAFLVGDSHAATLDDIVRRLRAVLPPHMVPSHVEWLESLPRTSSGKRDDEALRRRPLTRQASNEPRTEPRDAEERALLEIVSEVMQTPDLGVHDDVFDLGATSLTAMRLVMRIEHRFGVNLPLSRFVESPTVAGLAAHLRERGGTASFDPLVRIRAGLDRPPLFLVHPMGGNVLCYLPLARHLPDGQPLYALQAAGADPGSEPLSSVPELASSYLEAIRRVQPEGPYTLGGWSFGGFVAFEMARQLREAGEELTELFIVDTIVLDPSKGAIGPAESHLGWFFWELLWIEHGTNAPWKGIPEDVVTLDAKFEFIAQMAIQLGVLPAGSTQGVVRRLFQVYEAHCQATFAYRPGVLDRNITLLRAAQPLPQVLRSMHDTAGSMHGDPTNGWAGRTSADLTIIEIPGDHLTMMIEPNVSHVATAILHPIEPKTWKRKKPSSLALESADYPPPLPSVELESIPKSGNEPPRSSRRVRHWR